MLEAWGVVQSVAIGLAVHWGPGARRGQPPLVAATWKQQRLWSLWWLENTFHGHVMSRDNNKKKVKGNSAKSWSVSLIFGFVFSLPALTFSFTVGEITRWLTNKNKKKKRMCGKSLSLKQLQQMGVQLLSYFQIFAVTAQTWLRTSGTNPHKHWKKLKKNSQFKSQQYQRPSASQASIQFTKCLTKIPWWIENR